MSNISTSIDHWTFNKIDKTGNKTKFASFATKDGFGVSIGLVKEQAGRIFIGC